MTAEMKVVNSQLYYENPEKFKLLQRAATALLASKFYDVKTDAEAIAKVLHGQELGIAPCQALNGIYLLKGKTALSAGLISTLIARHPAHYYEIKKCNDQECTIDFFRKNPDGSLTSRGESISFTIEEAKRAKLTDKEVWRSYPSDMLFARCISRAARRYAADVFGGSIYTPEELGADVDEEGNIININKKHLPNLKVINSKEEFNTELASPDQVNRLEELIYLLSMDKNITNLGLKSRGVNDFSELKSSVASGWILSLEERLRVLNTKGKKDEVYFLGQNIIVKDLEHLRNILFSGIEELEKRYKFNIILEDFKMEDIKDYTEKQLLELLEKINNIHDEKREEYDMKLTDEQLERSTELSGHHEGL